MVAISTRGGPHRPQCIGTCARLGEAQCADRAAGAEVRQIFAALLLVAVAIDVVGAQVVMRYPGERHGVVPAGEAL